MNIQTIPPRKNKAPVGVGHCKPYHFGGTGIGNGGAIDAATDNAVSPNVASSSSYTASRKLYGSTIILVEHFCCVRDWRCRDELLSMTPLESSSVFCRSMTNVQF